MALQRTSEEADTRVKAAGIFAALSLVAACGNTGGIGLTKNNDTISRNLPYGVDTRGSGVDGLLVGHRLMEADEYELALKAYLRGAAENGMTVDVLSALGSANLALGRLGQSEALLRRALDVDPTFVPALNNLGVVLIERGKNGEARVIFQRAFAQDSGQSDSIRENLRLAIAKTENTAYDDSQTEDPKFNLVRRGQGQYELLSQL